MRKLSHLTAMAHHGLKAVLRIQVPPLHKSVFGATQNEAENSVKGLTALKQTSQLKNDTNKRKQFASKEIKAQTERTEKAVHTQVTCVQCF